MLPLKVSEDEFSGGKYAIHEVKHTAEDIQKAWTNIFSELSNGGYPIDDQPAFERYSREMLSNHICEIYVPIK
ncbi:GyrI-like domain-containing protein [Domibacillus indicus]|uniref:GyrI-like domain-containing protein n=1 Tax=Domibacillus indicus TaxID=1437523 RepID=UPI00288BFA46|nr:GyrI-like domain-containing protein [Domibacillus indicus]